MKIIKKFNLDSANFYSSNVTILDDSDSNNARLRDVTFFTENELIELLTHVPADKWEEISNR